MEYKMLRLQHPFSMIVSGPSQCGKSTFTCNLIRNIGRAVNAKFDRVEWYNTEKAAFPNNLRGLTVRVQFMSIIPEEFTNVGGKPLLIILDDMMNDVKAAMKICDLFTRGSHHRNISVILIMQNIFHQSRYSRDISLNAKYIVIFKNPRDKSQFNHLARQIYPDNPAELQRIYKEITQYGHGYLFIDLSQSVDDIFRFRTDIFAKDRTICYCDKNLLQPIENTNIESNEAIETEPAYFACTKISKPQTTQVNPKPRFAGGHKNTM